MKRPNPVNGRTVVPQDPRLIYTKEDMERVLTHARRKVFEELGITNLNAVRTPSSLWFAEQACGDHFPELINRERGSLVMGNHTDDELANEVFLYGNMSIEEKHRAMMNGKSSSIAYLTAGKERIRWLSRHLEAALARGELLLEQVQGLRQLILDFDIELPDALVPGLDEHTNAYANGANYMRDLTKGKLGFDYHHKDPTDGSKVEIPVVADLKNGMETVIRDKHGCSGIVRPLSIPADKVWAFLIENDEYQGYNPEFFRKHALEILPEHYVENAMQPILTKLYLAGDIDKDGTRSGCLGSAVRYTGPIFKGTIPDPEDGNSQPPTLNQNEKELVELKAREIYDSWSGQSGWVAWAPGGNSNKQQLAREKAREVLSNKGE